MSDTKTKAVLDLFKFLPLSAELYSDPKFENDVIPEEVTQIILQLKDSRKISNLLIEFEHELYNNAIDLEPDDRKPFLEYTVKRFHDYIGLTFFSNRDLIQTELDNTNLDQGIDMTKLNEEEQSAEIFRIMSDEKEVELTGHMLHLYCLESMFHKTMRRVNTVASVLNIPCSKSEDGWILFNNETELPGYYINDGWKIKFKFKSDATTAQFLRILILKDIIEVNPVYRKLIDSALQDDLRATKISAQKKQSTQKVQAMVARSFEQVIDFESKSFEYLRKLFSPENPFDQKKTDVLMKIPSLDQIEGKIL